MRMDTRERGRKKEEATIHSPKLWKDNAKLKSMTNAQLSNWNDRNHEKKLTLYACKQSFEAARIAAGGVLVSMDYIFKGNGFRGLVFCVIRPPGYKCFWNFELNNGPLNIY